MTLTQAAIATKKGLVILAILLVMGLVGWLSYQYYYYNIYLPSIPKKVEIPTTEYGVLPKLAFPQTRPSSSNFSYSLDTETGTLPEGLPNLIKIYHIPQPGTSLLAPDRAKNLAISFLFPNGPVLLSTTLYKFTDNNNGQFVIDLNNSNFKFEHLLLASDNAEVASGSAKEQDLAIKEKAELAQEFKGYLSSKGILRPQLINGRTEVNYDAALQKDSNHATISIWQEDIDELPIVTPKFNQSLVDGLITKFRREDQRFLQLNYIYWQVDKETFSTYPIKSAQQAYETLQSGGGNIIISPNKSQVSIAKVYLAYYLSEEYSPYLQPVYVFEGPSFAAYVPAVTDEFIAK